MHALAPFLCFLAAGALAAPDAPTCQLLTKLDCTGSSLASLSVGVTECCTLCARVDGCTSFAYQGVCHLKSGCAGRGDEPSSLEGWQTTDDLSQLLAPMTGLPEFQPGGPVPARPSVTVDTRARFQTCLGFGGAFTEAAALGFFSLSEEDQKRVLALYFTAPEDGGLGYSLGRVHMNSCDFSVASYSFDDVPGDQDLVHFDHTVAHDQATMLPFIRAALQVNPNLKIYASPWSPPAWMKNNGQMTGSDQPGLRDDAQAAWAKYFSRFFDAYANQGVKLWGLTVQNEPEYAAPWEACVYTAEQERDFLKNHLGPVMRKDHPDVKIMIHDHNKDDVQVFARTIYGDPEAAQYADGVGIHWYVNPPDGGAAHLQEAHSVMPNGTFILATEACNCPDVSLRDWGRAAAIARDMFVDFDNWVTGWVDWNLVLDHTGGPNHLGNNCDANIIADPAQVLGQGTLIQQVSFYTMGHFSKFVRPGMVRVAATSSVGEVSAWLDERTGRVAVVLLEEGTGAILVDIVDVASNRTAHAVQLRQGMQSFTFLSK